MSGLHRIGNCTTDQLNSTNRIVIARNRIINRIRITVGVNDSDYRDTQTVSLGNGNRLTVDIHDEQGTRGLLHVQHPRQIATQFLMRMTQRSRFLLMHGIVTTLGFQFIKLAQSFHSCANCLGIGQCTTQPTTIHIMLAAAIGCLTNNITCLLLGAYKKNTLTTQNRVMQKFKG